VRPVRRVLVLVLSALALVLGTVGPATAAGDDYPWRTDTTGSADRFGFTKRQCTSFAAWRLAQRGTVLSNAAQGWGDAHYWDDAAYRLRHGRGFTPVVGAVAHWNPSEASPYYGSGSPVANGTFRSGAKGHVASVQSVHGDGSVTVSQYNVNGSRAYSTMRVRAPRFLYVGIPTPR
jgi:surface antigen